MTPTIAEYDSFIADTKPNKRAAKIDELLANDAFADFWTAIWGEQLRIMGGDYAPVGTLVKAADTYYEWIRKQMRALV